MQFLRKSAVGMAASLLVITLFTFGWAWSAHRVFGSVGNVKQALRASGIYQLVVSELLDQQKSSGGDNIPTTDPQVRKVIEQSFPPSFLQSQTEQVLDAGYNWLHGKTGSLQFTIDLTNAKTTLADGLEHYAQTRLNSLPTCNANSLPTGDIDAFNATCLPPGFDSAAAAAKVHDDIINGDFLKNTHITADSIKTNDGKTLGQQLHAAPATYKRASLGVYGGGVFAILLTALIIWASSSWRAGVRRCALIFISVGAVSGLLGWLSSYSVHHIALKIASTQTHNQPLQTQIIAIVQSLTDDLRNWWVGYGVTLVILGTAAIIALLLARSKGSAPANANNPADLGSTSKIEGDDAAAQTSQPKTPKVPTKPKKIVQ